jgi:hypothetical protein
MGSGLARLLLVLAAVGDPTDLARDEPARRGAASRGLDRGPRRRRRGRSPPSGPRSARRARRSSSRPPPSAAHERLVTFLYQSSGTHVHVVLVADFADYVPHMTLQRLPETDVWFRTLPLPDDARFLYELSVDDPGFRSRTARRSAGPPPRGPTRSTRARTTSPSRRSSRSSSCRARRRSS